jgi:hypothetical protein
MKTTEVVNSDRAHFRIIKSYAFSKYYRRVRFWLHIYNESLKSYT